MACKFKIGDAVVLKNRHTDRANPYNYYSPIMTVTDLNIDSGSWDVVTSWFDGSGIHQATFDHGALEEYVDKTGA